MAKLVRILWIPVILLALYTGWVMWKRSPFPWRRGSDYVAPDPMAAYGNRVKILQFYARDREIKPDGTALICYGAVNAKELQLDPPVDKVWPTVSRCFDVHPSSSTRYTLTAIGPNHATVSESIEITVKP